MNRFMLMPKRVKEEKVKCSKQKNAATEPVYL